MEPAVNGGCSEAAAVGSSCPRPTAPASEQDGVPSIGRLIMSYIPPWLPEPPHYSPNHHGSRVGQILAIAVVVALAGFLVAVFIANVTAGGG